MHALRKTTRSYFHAICGLIRRRDPLLRARVSPRAGWPSPVYHTDDVGGGGGARSWPDGRMGGREVGRDEDGGFSQPDPSSILSKLDVRRRRTEGWGCGRCWWWRIWPEIASGSPLCPRARFVIRLANPAAWSWQLTNLSLNTYRSGCGERERARERERKERTRDSTA